MRWLEMQDKDKCEKRLDKQKMGISFLHYQDTEHWKYDTYYTGLTPLSTSYNDI